MVLSPKGVPIQKRLEGDTYQIQGPSGAPYFLVVTGQSATTEETNAAEDTLVENGFMSAFDAAYQNPSGQTSVTAVVQVDDPPIQSVVASINMDNGVIQEIQPQDMEEIMGALNDFRGGVGAPILFAVALYTGIIGVAGAGLIANLVWNGGN
jgi:hypothetical protein